MSRIILASASPRRRDLMSLLNIPFEIIPAVSDEVISEKSPSLAAQKLAESKAEEVMDGLIFDDNETIVVIGADTVVSCNCKILGKPMDTDDAVCMLREIQGSSHEVYTGVSIIWKSPNDERKKLSFSECTKVNVYAMTDDEIRAYVATGEPMDKAGSYGIQGFFAAYVKKIDGDYNNVVGLPLSKVYHELINLKLLK